MGYHFREFSYLITENIEIDSVPSGIARRDDKDKLSSDEKNRATSMKISGRTSVGQGLPSITLEYVMDEIKRRGSPKAVAGMARFGIETGTALGVSIPQLRYLAKKVGTDHELAQKLWKTGIHEARILASMIDDPTKTSEAQMEEWAADFDSWDVVDGCCGNLFDKTKFANRKANEWSARKEEFVKRAGFVLIAELAVHNKEASNKTFLDFLPLIIREASDERNFVKKAVNWALRQIGKRNTVLNAAAIKTCARIRNLDSGSAKWVAADALRELTSASVGKKLARVKPERSKR